MWQLSGCQPHQQSSAAKISPSTASSLHPALPRHPSSLPLSPTKPGQGLVLAASFPGKVSSSGNVSMFCSAERVDMALEVWNQMHDKGILPCMHMFSSLINGLCNKDRLEEACRYFQEMLDKGIRPPGQLFGRLKDALLDGGRKDLAVDLGLKLDRLRKTQMIG